MTTLIRQTPLSEALCATATSGGIYETHFPQPICFGNVCFGGVVLSFIHAAAADHFSSETRTARQTHARSLAANFFRPIFPAPDVSTVLIKTINVGKAWSTARVEVCQRGKTCLAGYITMTDLSQPGEFSFDTRWSLLPPAPPVSLLALDADVETGWIGYRTPFVANSFRRAQSYVEFFVPLTLDDPSFVDQWVRPGWTELDSPNGAKWTNDMVHFVTDCSLPILDNLFPRGEASGTHAAVVAYGKAQRAARKSGVPFVEDKASYATPAMITTLSLQTEVKKLLPVSGVPWLFMRARAKQVRDNRMDMEVVLLDEGAELVAITNHVLHVVNVQAAKTRKPAL